MEIIGHTVEKLNDPTGILVGDRYEFFINIDVPEDDELFSGNGIHIKVIFAVDENGARIALYHLIENVTNQYFDFELEDDELEMISEYCKKHLE
ncbi:DUF6509 family protein [Ferdinandcohnia quinoae]|uniref:DUF6509 family protein n=1 Tax=Fredinandcohnia quinoae TaxID=2918902 RepID=A0AAW5E192_9BACI|nr:DUF6509 family protein [Fredinandcohnia sp. SECRCQ15]MCH1626671.1 DUF6509 family protein [Fredinandcohnia sp. SECRCQ15]